MKLKIDIKPEDQVIPLEQGFIYRWDRIALAAIAAVVLLGLIGTGLFKLLTPNDTEPTLEPSTISTAPGETEAPSADQTVATDASPYFLDDEPASDSVSSAGDDSETTTEAAQPAESLAAISPPTVSAEEPEPATAETSPSIENRTAQPETNATESAAQAAQVRPVTAAAGTSTATGTPLATTSRPAAEPARQPTSDEGKPFSGLSTEIHSNKIKRFIIAKGVRDKEPVGTLNDITLNKNEVATIYAYSEALNFKDDTLRYVWTLNGKQVAEVKVPVWSARWRSYSSKFVTSGMRGDWQVELRDQHDELLAVSEFQY